jgi:hypothetical protein
MKLKLLLCLFAALATVRAANYVGDQTFAAPFTLNEGVNIVGNLTLSYQSRTAPARAPALALKERNDVSGRSYACPPTIGPQPIIQKSP